MNINQHRKIVAALQTEADQIRAALLAKLQAEGSTPEQIAGIEWTGQARVIGQTVWHEFQTPGSWAGRTYYRFNAVDPSRRELKSREPEDVEATPAIPVYDGKKAWQFVVESYDGAGYSPDRREWTDAQVLEFVDEHHVVGREAFRLP